MSEQRSGKQLLSDGLETITNPDKLREAMNEVFENAFVSVFRMQDEGKLQWKREGENLTDLVTEATVKNGRGQEIIITVILFAGVSPKGSKECFLWLGSKRNAPYRNDIDLRVQRLYAQVTEKPWSYSSY